MILQFPSLDLVAVFRVIGMLAFRLFRNKVSLKPLRRGLVFVLGGIPRFRLV